MATTPTPLRARLRTVRRRWLAIGWAAGMAWGLAAVVVLWLVAVWLDLLWELSPEWRIGLAAGAAVGGCLLLAASVWRTLHAGRLPLLARRVDHAAGSGGEVLTGLELDRAVAPAASPTPRADLTAGLAQMAVADAARLAASVPAGRVAPVRPAGRSLGTLMGLLAGVGLLTLSWPGLARTQWNRFFNPFGDVPPFSATTFEVEPGNTPVLYGSELNVRATVVGPAVDQLELVMENDAGAQERLPMFPEQDGRWRAVVTRVTAPAMYYVRAYRARSEKYRLDVITVPQIERVRLRIVPPQYANRPVYEGSLPKDGVVGLRGTQVQVWAGSNRPLGGGTMVIKPVGDAAHDGKGEPAAAVEVAMKPTADTATEVFGEFPISGDGKFSLRVADTAGQTSQQEFTGTITLLADARPFIRLLHPKPMSLATPAAVLPVVVAAEDDCGISAVQLFRSLNDSRPLPGEVKLARHWPRRVQQQIDLPLAEYGLAPGDVIKLFARVEDNDPAGAKGAESTVVTVEIISQEEFDRMLRVREGVETLMSKYRTTQRSMESLADEIEQLRKKLKQQAAAGKVGEAERQQLKRLTKRLREQAEQFRKLAAHKLPYDLDRQLSPQLEQLAKLPDEAAAELEKLLKQADLSHEALERQLAKMAGRLANERQQYEQAAMLPLDLLEAVFPLLADQARFAMLVLQQQDLAERLAALKGHDGEDNPALKSRMRDLEQEQRQVREELGKLLDDIDDHIKRLPEDEKVAKLRQTAQEFVKAVRGSAAAAEMTEAEAGLADFSGTRGYEHAKRAAEILAEFLPQSEAMGGAGSGCLVFQPGLATGLGNTVAQLLGEMGLGTGSGTGGGRGAGGGYSALRGLGRNMGLYGSQSSMGDALGNGQEGSGPAQDDPHGTFTQGGANPDQDNRLDTSAIGVAAGSSEATVPTRYRRRVGQYFQRIATEETE